MFKIIRKIRKSLRKKSQTAADNESQMMGIKLLNGNFVEAVHNASVANGSPSSYMLSEEYCFPVKNFNQAFQKLADTGICVLENFVDGSAQTAITEIIEELVSTKNEDTLENVIFQTGLQGEYKSARELIDSKKTIVVKRSGQDNGMFDIFNLDLYPNLSKLIDRKIKSNNAVQSFCEKYELKVSNVNAYYNNSVSQTRGFHVDGWKSQYKMLIYLTDVLSPKYGPYCYIPQSHTDKNARKINQITFPNFPTETPIFDIGAPKLVLAKAGSGVLSDQVGFHRGFPQADGYSRCVLMLNFRSVADD
jgi:hypothetical protein